MERFSHDSIRRILRFRMTQLNQLNQLSPEDSIQFEGHQQPGALPGAQKASSDEWLTSYVVNIGMHG